MRTVLLFSYISSKVILKLHLALEQARTQDFFWGSRRVLKARESRRRRRRGGGVRGGGVSLPAEKFLYFKYENDAFWCIFGGVGVKIRLPIPPTKKRPRFHALITIR
jgi:hypothetical protein